MIDSSIGPLPLRGLRSTGPRREGIENRGFDSTSLAPPTALTRRLNGHTAPCQDEQVSAACHTSGPSPKFYQTRTTSQAATANLSLCSWATTRSDLA